MTLETGHRLGHYRIDRLIGQGGMGAVYLAEDTRLERRVALKVLPPAMASDSGRLERFRREAKAVAALNHPNIVTIHSIEQEGDQHFLTMELVEGVSLNHELPPGGLPLSRLFEVSIALADALSAAHEKGIVHRDLKPANVMITAAGRIKVLDFGLAKLISNPRAAGDGADFGGAARETTAGPTQLTDPEDTLTVAGMVVGTVPYMSPEQVGGEAIDARSDIFSLGVLLYEMATGRRPFVGRNNAETISAILRDPPPPLTDARNDAPRHLGRILDRCLQKDPRDRYPTAREVFDELRALRKEMESDTSEVGVVAPAAAPALPAAAPASPVAAPAPAHAQARSMAGLPSMGGGGRSFTETNSLAVLPFANMSSDPEQEYFSDGLTEELLSALTKIRELKVTGRTSSFSFKGKNEDLRVIGRQLGVANILEGSVRKAGNRVRITAQLVNTEDGFHLWSETYDRTLDDIFAVQDDIAKSVAQELQVTLLGRSAPGGMPNVDAFDLVLQARFVLQARHEEAIRRGRAMLERALQVCPEYAPAWAEMSLVHSREYERATRVEDKQRILEQRRRTLARALEIDPNMAVAHSRMASVQRDCWDFAGAALSTEKALAADPKNPIVLGNASSQYAALGRFEEAIALGLRAQQSDPLNILLLFNVGLAYMAAGRLESAEGQFRRLVELNSDYGPVYRSLGSLEMLRGRTEEARALYGKGEALNSLSEADGSWLEAMLRHSEGQAVASTAAAEQCERQKGAQDPVTCAQVRAWRGEPDLAFAWLERALALRDPSLSRVHVDPFLVRLHDDPRWNVLLERIGLRTG